MSNEYPNDIRDLREEARLKLSNAKSKAKELNWFSISEKIIIFLVGIGIFYLFSWYAIYAMAISSIFYFFFFKEFMTIPIRTFLKINVETREISRVVIPWKKYKEYKKKGLYNPFSNIEVIKEIDIEKKEIEGFWFAELNEVEFLIKAETLMKLADEFKQWLNEYAKTIIITDIQAYNKAQEWLIDLNNIMMDIPSDKTEIFNKGGD